MKKLIGISVVVIALFALSGCSHYNTNFENKMQGKKVVKFVMAVTRKDGMSKEAFKEYWKNNHGVYFTKNAYKMNAIKYVQTYIIDTPMNKYIKNSRNMREPYDGIAEVWFESIEEMQKGMNSKEGQKLGNYLLKDEKTFINHKKSTAFIANEIELF